MGKINLVRVVLGGLLAGLVVNIGEFILNTYVIADDQSKILTRLNLPPIGQPQVVQFVVLTFLMGIVLVWIYAGIRPRFGAGAKTAIIAAVTLWVVVGLFNAQLVVVGMVTVGENVVPAIWGLVELAIAAVAGAWLYQESASS